MSFPFLCVLDVNMDQWFVNGAIVFEQNKSLASRCPAAGCFPNFRRHANAFYGIISSVFEKMWIVMTRAPV